MGCEVRKSVWNAKMLKFLEWKDGFVLNKTKVKDKWAWDIIFKKNSSLSNSYYPIAEKTRVRRPFKFVTHKWIGVRKSI